MSFRASLESPRVFFDLESEDDELEEEDDEVAFELDEEEELEELEELEGDLRLL